jgi:hypothetical protein
VRGLWRCAEGRVGLAWGEAAEVGLGVEDGEQAQDHIKPCAVFQAGLELNKPDAAHTGSLSQLSLGQTALLPHGPHPDPKVLRQVHRRRCFHPATLPQHVSVWQHHPQCPAPPGAEALRSKSARRPQVLKTGGQLAGRKVSWAVEVVVVTFRRWRSALGVRLVVRALRRGSMPLAACLWKVVTEFFWG